MGRISSGEEVGNFGEENQDKKYGSGEEYQVVWNFIHQCLVLKQHTICSCTMTMLTDVKQAVMAVICADDNKPLTLVRKHDKSLAKLGDFSFPSPRNAKIWGTSDQESCIEDNLSKVKIISKIIQGPKSWLVYLNRAEAMRRMFQGPQTSPDKLSGSRIKVTSPENMKGDLTAARVAFLSELLGKSSKYFF